MCRSSQSKEMRTNFGKSEQSDTRPGETLPRKRLSIVLERPRFSELPIIQDNGQSTYGREVQRVNIVSA